MLKLEPSVLEDCKIVTSDNSTDDGIHMLGIGYLEHRCEYNRAGNKYLDALRTIKRLLEELGEDSVLYE